MTFKNEICFKQFSKKQDEILMDYRIPLKNGIEPSKKIVQMNPESKIILATDEHEVEK